MELHRGNLCKKIELFTYSDIKISIKIWVSKLNFEKESSCPPLLPEKLRISP